MQKREAKKNKLKEKQNRGSSFAEFFREIFAVVQRYSVEAVKNLEIDDAGDEGKSQEDGDHNPGAVEVAGNENDRVTDSKAANDDTEGDENAELGRLLAADFGEIDLLGRHKGAKVAHRTIYQGG